MTAAPITHPRQLSPTPDSGRTRATLADTPCTHCGLSVPQGLIRHESTSQFCCNGCEAAYALIHSCGLDRYYDVRARAERSGSVRVRRTDRAYAEFDQDVFRSLYVRAQAGSICSVELLLQGMHCGACVWLVEKLPQLAPGVLDARVDLRRGQATITWDDAQVSLSRIARTLETIGYAPSPARDARSRLAAARSDRAQLVRIGVAGACAGNIMLLAICLYAGWFEGIDPAHQAYFRWISMGLTAISLAWPGAVFFRSAWASIKTRTPHLDIPITLALVVGAAWSVYTTLRGSGEIYFDSLSALVFVLLVGRYVQHRQQRWAADSMELLFALTPTFARRVTHDDIAEVPLEAIATGDLLAVRAGETLAADGVIERGEARIDESLLTGESTPRRVGIGSIVSAGTLNTSGDLRLRVTAAGEETRLARLMRLVESASQRRAPIVELANRLSAWFVVGMTSLAIVTGLIWLFIDPHRAVDQSVAMLVVTCPCALGLATPLTLTVALARASRQGLLIKGGDAVQRLAHARTVYLDKTGTLTTGRMSLVEFIGDERAKPLISALEARSTHVIARSLVRDLGASTLPVEDVEQMTGAGIRAIVAGQRVGIGSPAFIANELDTTCAAESAIAVPQSIIDQGLTPVAVSIDGALVAWLGLGDHLRADTRDSVDRLRSLGFTLAILSGDDQRVVDRVGAQLGITDARGRLSPEDKLAVVRTHAPDSPCVFVGDGVNDGAALAAASVGIAVHGGAEVSLSIADIYLSTPGLGGVVSAIEGSRRTMRVIVRNLFASGAYNLIAVAGTLMGMVTPLLAALIMPMSSITVLTLAIVAWTFGPRTSPWARAFRHMTDHSTSSHAPTLAGGEA